MQRHRSSSSIKNSLFCQFIFCRGDYAKVSQNDVDFFSGIIGESHVICEDDDIAGYNIDWLRTVRGQSRVRIYCIAKKLNLIGVVK